ELADRRDPRAQHLDEAPARYVVHVLRRQTTRSRIHLLAPAPEIGCARVRGPPLRAPADQPLERVRVRIDEAGQQCAAGESLGTVQLQLMRDAADPARALVE